MNFNNVNFHESVFSLKQLPDSTIPEIAFAGRSNVGKSSLINRLVNRRNLVKTSARPGKTQSLIFFDVDRKLFLVDLPGYGFARVSKTIQSAWDLLITEYLEHRENLACVVVIIDIRHELKAQDRELVEWLRFRDRPFILVYTKADKLSRNKQFQQAAILDRALGIRPDDRILFSAKTGQGSDSLHRILASAVENW